MELHPTSVLLLLSCFMVASYAHNVHLSTLNQSLIVSDSATPGKVLKAGVDTLTITWAYNTNLTVSDANYTTIEAKLCYAPLSQTGRDDRKTDDNLDFDKTCPFDITNGTYKRANTFTWTIPKDTPSATYFVRVYVINAKNHEIAYGQTTNDQKTTNLFQVDGVVSEQKGSGAWSVIGNSFGYRYAWLLMLVLIL
ncbi:high-affinity nitrate transporter 3.1-like [Bidens hawaiensis]|uniref:high-affinity nitrate transporter 3.1-like n=1 Tax=Bidens hawaiensis TaxID=980011 RepID=UPI004048FAE3